MLQKFEAYQIAKSFHLQCKGIALRGEMKDQIVRASGSIALNLAEGSAKFSAKEQRNYYSRAMASLRECQAILDLEDYTDPNLLSLSDRLAAILYKLTKSRPPPPP